LLNLLHQLELHACYSLHFLVENFQEVLILWDINIDFFV
jgi:hypothetical protein